MQDITYCLSCKKDSINIDPKVIKTKNNRKMMLSRCSICNNKKSTFISQGSGLFDSLGLNTPQNRMKNALWNANMNNVINKFLLAGDKFMPEMHLRQPRFVYSACGPFTRHKERTKKIKQTGDTRYIYRNELDKVCFQHDSTFADHKDLINRTKSDKVLRDKAYDIASNPEYDGYQRGLASMVYKFFDSKVASSDKKSMESGIKKDTTKSSSLILGT